MGYFRSREWSLVGFVDFFRVPKSGFLQRLMFGYALKADPRNFESQGALLPLGAVAAVAEPSLRFVTRS